jgi:starvation-inducible outer membrane lipoprotein
MSEAETMCYTRCADIRFADSLPADSQSRLAEPLAQMRLLFPLSLGNPCTMLLIVFAILLVSYGCSYNPFPEHVTRGIDPTFQFSTWRVAAEQVPATKVQLGGRIIETHKRQNGTTFVVQELPIVKYPAYGPKKTKSKGEFAILYQADVDSGFLRPGNRIMVAGTTAGTVKVALDDVIRGLPAINASCIHIWKTGDTDIADYASAGAGYAVLEEETFCGHPG